jgi:hypothetical protein
LSRWGRPLIVKSDLKPPPGVEKVEFLGLDHCYAPTIPEQRVEDDIVAHFANSIRTGSRPNCDGPTGLHIAEQQMMAYVSARESRTIDLTTTFDLWWDREPGIMDVSEGFL